MRLLDLFCGAGGAAMGYFYSGFSEIVGVDHLPQKNYPFDLVLGDALEYLEENSWRFDAIHASPPCQRYSVQTIVRGSRDQHPDLVGPTRTALERAGKPWVIENVPGAPLRDPVMLCGTFFGLKVIRHRLFESSAPLGPTGMKCRHPRGGCTGNRGKAMRQGQTHLSVVGHFSNVKFARKAMGIGWMTRDELSQAIPPDYTKWVGERLREEMCRRTR